MLADHEAALIAGKVDRVKPDAPTVFCSAGLADSALVQLIPNCVGRNCREVFR